MKIIQYWTSFVYDPSVAAVPEAAPGPETFVPFLKHLPPTETILKAIAAPMVPVPEATAWWDWVPPLVPIPDIPLPFASIPAGVLALPSEAALLLLVPLALLAVAWWMQWVVRIPRGKFLVLLSEGSVCRVTDAPLVIRSPRETIHSAADRTVSSTMERQITVGDQHYVFHFTISLRIANLLHFFHYGHPPDYSLAQCEADMRAKLDALFHNLSEHDLLMIQLNPDAAADFRARYTELLRYRRSVHDKQGATEILDLRYTLSYAPPEPAPDLNPPRAEGVLSAQEIKND